MAPSPIPEPLRRFILTSVPSVPFVEAMLLFRSNREAVVDTGFVARGLYIADSQAAHVVRQLVSARIVEPVGDPQRGHRYAPGTTELAAHLDALASFYA